MNDFIPKPTEDQAEFNNAFAFLERLNRIEYMIEDSLMKWNLIDCFSILESYENELFFSFKNGSKKDGGKSDEEKVNAIKVIIIKILNDNPGICGKGRDAGGKPYLIGGDNVGELRKQLVELNKLLRNIKHKAGMGMAMKGEGKLF